MTQSFITLYLQDDEYSGVVKTIFTYIGIKVGVQEGSECVDTRGVSGVGVGSRGFIGDRGWCTCGQEETGWGGRGVGGREP